jgi:hypothetical protein
MMLRECSVLGGCFLHCLHEPLEAQNVAMLLYGLSSLE